PGTAIISGHEKTRPLARPGSRGRWLPERGGSRSWGSGLLGGLGRLGGDALGLLGGGLDLALGDLADGLAALQAVGEGFLAGVDAALDVLARNLHALGPQGLVAVAVARLGDFTEERERGVGVLLQ